LSQLPQSRDFGKFKPRSTKFLKTPFSRNSFREADFPFT
jgi:hypothetical protein